jgi:hypothetical protein
LAEEKTVRTTLDQDQRQQEIEPPPPPPLQQSQQLHQEEAQAQVEQITDLTAEGKQASAAAAMDSSLQTFRPPPPPQQHMQTAGRSSDRQPEIQLQQEQIQYVDNECCQVAVTANPPMESATMKKTTVGTTQRSKTDTMKSAAHQFSTLERNMAEVAEQNRRSERELQARTNATMDRRSHYGGGAASCDTCDAPLTPASLAGIDHRDLEHRPLTRSVTRATVYDEPPEK